MKIKELLEKVKRIHNQNYKKIMYRLINIYRNECRYMEGDLGYTDLYEIYSLLEREDNKR